MVHSYLSRATLIFLSTTLAVLTVACKQDKQTTATRGNESVQTSNLAVSPAVEEVAPSASPQTSPSLPQLTEPNYFQQGLDKAVGAISISQSAQGADDWNLVASQLIEAIALMKKVPATSPDFPNAQIKIREYDRQSKYAQQQATPRPVALPKEEPSKVVVLVPQAPKTANITPQPQTASACDDINLAQPNCSKPPQQPRISQLDCDRLRCPEPIIPEKQPIRRTAITQDEVNTQQVFTVPIKRRIGGTPIIEVTFNGNQRFEMIVDTGASGTVITPKMASALGVVAVSKAKANTASSKAVEFSIGYVDSVEVGGVAVGKIPVAIAGVELETGLLGHDFFGNYDLTIKRNVVELRPQSRSDLNPAETELTPATSPKPRQFEGYP